MKLSAVWVVLPIGALCLGGVVWLVSAIPAASGELPEPTPLPAVQQVGVETSAPRARPAPREAEVIAQPSAPQPVTPAAIEAPRSSDDEDFHRAQETIRGQVTAQYANRHKEVMSRCWPQDAPEDQRARLVLSLQVDENGQELVRSVRETREAWLEGFSHCFASAAREPFEFEAPGRSVSVDVVLDFP